MKNVNDAEKELPDIIGKEATEKLLKQESKEVQGSYRKVQELKNADLKVGGEGMKGFYDKILPNAIEKIGKEHGVKVKTLATKEPTFSAYKNDKKVSPEFKSAKEAREWAANQGLQSKASIRENEGANHIPIHYIDIPQSLRNVAMKKGFPLFSSGYPGMMLTPIEGDPFNRKK